MILTERAVKVEVLACLVNFYRAAFADVANGLRGCKQNSLSMDVTGLKREESERARRLPPTVI